MSSEEPGLLGNLPRSRPGTRSDKRAVPAEAGELVQEPGAKKAPAKAKAKATKPRAKAQTKAATPPPAPSAEHEPDAAAGPLRSAAKVAGTGLRVAEGVTREVLRRLPRP